MASCTISVSSSRRPAKRNKCLNTKIGHSNDINNARKIKIEQLCSSIPKQLIGKDVVEIQQDVGGIVMEYSVLCQVYSVNDWHIHHCSNCSTDVYLSHSVKQDKIFAFNDLIVDPYSLIESQHYSKVFGIVLWEMDDRIISETPRKRLSSMNYGKEDPVLKLVHTRMKSFLHQQEELVEERIKKYEQEQREQFVKLQKLAHEERRQLFEAIHKSRESGITEEKVNVEEANTKPEVKSPVTMGFDVSTNPTTKRKDMNFTSKLHSYRKVMNVKEQETKKELPSKNPELLGGDDDDDGLFTFDEELKHESSRDYQGKPTDSTPFGLSSDDDDDSSTDGSSFHDELVIKQVPSSLPMAMPFFERLNKQNQYCGSVDNQIDPSDVANSIKLLALSVQDTGMFGDLPKPRLNSRP